DPRTEALAVHHKFGPTLQLPSVERSDKRLQRPLPDHLGTAQILEGAQRSLVSVLDDHRRNIPTAQEFLGLNRHRIHEPRARWTVEDDAPALKSPQPLEFLHRQPCAVARLRCAIEARIDTD